MPVIERSTVCLVSPEKVWRMLGAYQRLPQWHPLIEKDASSATGDTRRLAFNDGSTLSDRLVAWSEDAMTTRMTQSSWPLTALTMTVSVADAGIKRSTITLRAEYAMTSGAEQEAHQRIDDFITQAFHWLNARYGKDYAAAGAAR